MPTNTTGEESPRLAVTIIAYSWQSSLARQRQVVLDRPTITIGSDPTCDIAIYEDGVAPRHAVLRHTAAGYEIADLGSATGTWVQGQRLTHPIPLHLGDTIRIPGTELIVTTPEQPAAVPPLPTPHSPGTSAPATTTSSEMLPISQQEVFAEQGTIATAPYCPLCGLTYAPGTTTCRQCGSPLSEAMTSS